MRFYLLGDLESNREEILQTSKVTQLHHIQDAEGVVSSDVEPRGGTYRAYEMTECHSDILL